MLQLDGCGEVGEPPWLLARLRLALGPLEALEPGDVVAHGAILSPVERLFAVLGAAAATVTLLTFFFRAWANLRRGRRYERYKRDLEGTSELELQRLREEIESKR